MRKGLLSILVLTSLLFTIPALAQRGHGPSEGGRGERPISRGLDIRQDGGRGIGSRHEHLRDRDYRGPLHDRDWRIIEGRCQFYYDGFWFIAPVEGIPEWFFDDQLWFVRLPGNTFVIYDYPYPNRLFYAVIID